MDRTEDQIELIDALRVLWKYKLVILAGTLICIIAVGIISFMQPKIYRVDMVILPGKIHQSKTKKIDYIDSSDNIKAIIQQGILRERILSYLKHNKPTYLVKNLNFKISIPRKSDIIKISHQTQNIELGLSVLDSLTAALHSFYADNREIYFADWNDRLSKLNSLIFIKNIEETAAKKRINTLQAMIAEPAMQTELTADKSNVQTLNAIRKQNIQVIELTRLLDEAQIGLTEIREEKKLNLDEIAQIEQSKKDFHFIQILKPPKATKNPIKPKLKVNLMVSMIGSMLLMIMLSFFIEYVRNQTKKHLNKKAYIQSTEEE